MTLKILIQLLTVAMAFVSCDPIGEYKYYITNDTNVDLLAIQQDDTIRILPGQEKEVGYESKVGDYPNPEACQPLSINELTLDDTIVANSFDASTWTHVNNSNYNNSCYQTVTRAD